MKTETVVEFQRDVDRGQEVIDEALAITKARMKKVGVPLRGMDDLRNWLRLNQGNREHETFTALWLDSGLHLIEAEEMFHGNLNEVNVSHREMVKTALRHNAHAVVVAHNHPSGDYRPSKNDVLMTKDLRKSLGMIDVNLIDHVVVTGDKVTSMDEEGMLGNRGDPLEQLIEFLHRNPRS